MQDKLSKMRQAAGRLVPIPDHGGLFEDTSKPLSEEPRSQRKLVRLRFTVNLTDELIERARAAAYYTPGLTLSSLVEKALMAELATLEDARGEPFPRMETEKLSPGRPLRVPQTG